MTELWERDAWELADAVRAGDLSAAELLDVALDRIEARNAELNAVCYLDADAARKRAAGDRRDGRRRRGPGPVRRRPDGGEGARAGGGLPRHARVAAVRGPHRRRPTAPRSRGCAAAGAVLVGLTTAPEFGIPSFTNSPLHGVTRNPWNPERTPGGSSGGSAAAVAAGMLPACTGSDGGGSIRIPSSYSGLPGFKTTFGLIGAGPEPFDDGLTSVHGPMVRSVRDAARYVDVDAGPTLTDPTSLPKPRSVRADRHVADAAREQLRGKRVAWSSTLGYGVCDPGVEDVTCGRGAAAGRRSRPRARRPRRPAAEAGPGLEPGQRAEPRGVALRRSEGPRSTTSTSCCAPRVEGLPHVRAHHLGQRRRPSPRAAHATAGGVRRGRPAAHADHGDHRATWPRACCSARSRAKRST